MALLGRVVVGVLACNNNYRRNAAASLSFVYTQINKNHKVSLFTPQRRQLQWCSGEDTTTVVGEKEKDWMENREDLNSVLEFLPVVKTSSQSLGWPSPRVVETLKAISQGPQHSKVDSGKNLFRAIQDIRNALNLSTHPLALSTANGYSRFFDQVTSCEEGNKWFGETIPAMADCVLRLPSMLEAHYKSADFIRCRDGLQTSLRILKSQEPGIVLLSQELIATLLACSFFCLFPSTNRVANHLQVINFDQLFASLHDYCNDKQESRCEDCFYAYYDRIKQDYCYRIKCYRIKQESKTTCMMDYFERIFSRMPLGNVSFERKVVADNIPEYPYPKPKAESRVSLCLFQVYNSGLIEDSSKEVLDVDFPDKSEINNSFFCDDDLLRASEWYPLWARLQVAMGLMMSPELIAGNLFLPCMADNEAIEVVGAERFIKYSLYDNFKIEGEFLDKREIDRMGRRKTRIIAIDALVNPGDGKGQYRHKFLLREVNKAFVCGLSEHPKWSRGWDRWQLKLFKGDNLFNGDLAYYNICHEYALNHGLGIVSGNSELKAIIKWLAATQGIRPFLVHYTIGSGGMEKEELQKLKQKVKQEQVIVLPYAPAWLFREAIMEDEDEDADKGTETVSGERDSDYETERESDVEY